MIDLSAHDGHKNKNSEFAKSKLCVYDIQSGFGNFSGAYSTPCQEILISNDSESSSMSVRIRGVASLDLTITLMPGEVLDERFTDFSSIDIVAVGEWRYLVRTVRLTI
jgi:hypothetical protein